MRSSPTFAALFTVAALLSLLPQAAAADGRFELPRITAWKPDPARGEVIIVDEASGEPARLALGDDYAGRYRLVDVEGDRIVLRRLGDEAIYFVLPTQGAPSREPRGEREEQMDDSPDTLAPIDPYRDAKPIDPYRDARPIDPYRGDDRPARHDDAAYEPAPRQPRDVERPRHEARPAAHAERRSPTQRPQPHIEPERRELSRAALDAVLSDLDQLRRDVAVRAEGRAVRIATLRANSFVASLGLKAGDLVRRVAGRPLDSPEAAAALYAHLARADSFAVELERDGREIVLHYRLVP